MLCPLVAAHGDQVVLLDGRLQGAGVVQHRPDGGLLEASVIQFLPVVEQILVVGIGMIGDERGLGMGADFLCLCM